MIPLNPNNTPIMTMPSKENDHQHNPVRFETSEPIDIPVMNKQLEELDIDDYDEDYLDHHITMSADAVQLPMKKTSHQKISPFSTETHSQASSIREHAESVNTIKVINKVVNYFIVTNETQALSIAEIEARCRVDLPASALIQLLQADDQHRFVIINDPSHNTTSFLAAVVGASQEDHVHIQVSDRFHSLYDESIKHVNRWRQSIVNYISNTENNFTSCDLSVLGQHFPRPAEIVVNVKLIELLEWDQSARFQIIRSNSKVYVRLATGEKVSEKSGDKELNAVQQWRDAVSQYLLSLPTYRARIHDIGQAVPRPAELSKSYKLSQLLQEDSSRFRVIPRGGSASSDIEVERIIDPQETEKLVEGWKEEIIRCLRESDRLPLELGTLGAIVARPEGLPKDIKLSAVLQRDRKHRFLIKDVNGIPCANLSHTVTGKKSPGKSPAAIAMESPARPAAGAPAMSGFSYPAEQSMSSSQSSFSSLGEEAFPLAAPAARMTELPAPAPVTEDWQHFHRVRPLIIPTSAKPSPTAGASTGLSYTSKSMSSPSTNPSMITPTSMIDLVSPQFSAAGLAIPLERYKIEIARYLYDEKKPMDLTFVGAAVQRPRNLPYQIKLKDLLREDMRFLVYCTPPNKVFVSLNPKTLSMTLRQIHDMLGGSKVPSPQHQSYVDDSYLHHHQQQMQQMQQQQRGGRPPTPSHSLPPTPPVRSPYMRGMNSPPPQHQPQQMQFATGTVPTSQPSPSQSHGLNRPHEASGNFLSTSTSASHDSHRDSQRDQGSWNSNHDGQAFVSVLDNMINSLLSDEEAANSNSIPASTAGPSPSVRGSGTGLAHPPGLGSAAAGSASTFSQNTLPYQPQPLATHGHSHSQGHGIVSPAMNPRERGMIRGLRVDVWLPIVFSDFDQFLIHDFIHSFRDAGFNTVDDLLYLYQRGHLTSSVIEQISNGRMKIGYYNRLVRGLNDLLLEHPPGFSLPG
jgi:hypothetical protein